MDKSIKYFHFSFNIEISVQYNFAKNDSNVCFKLHDLSLLLVINYELSVGFGKQYWKQIHLDNLNIAKKQ